MKGSVIQSGTIELMFDTLLTFDTANVSAALIGSNLLEIPYTNLEPYEHRYVNVYFQVDPLAVLGTTVTNTATISPVNSDTTPVNNTSTYTRIVTNSYDPNDKHVIPPGSISPTQVSGGIDLFYTINFQNVGNAEAIDINIFDQLDINLDLNTFRVINSSAPMTWNIGFNRQLHFTFDNINLPDSTSNEPGSHGFVTYAIQPLITLTEGSLINNTAAIYFDNNSAVITNTVTTEVITSTGIHTPGNTEIRLYPNPNEGSFEIFTAFYGMTEYSIINSLGQVMQSATIFIVDGACKMNVSNMAAGLYTLKLKNTNSHSSIRFVKF